MNTIYIKHHLELNCHFFFKLFTCVLKLKSTNQIAFLYMSTTVSDDPKDSIPIAPLPDWLAAFTVEDEILPCEGDPLNNPSIQLEISPQKSAPKSTSEQISNTKKSKKNTKTSLTQAPPSPDSQDDSSPSLNQTMPQSKTDITKTPSKNGKAALSNTPKSTIGKQKTMTIPTKPPQPKYTNEKMASEKNKKDKKQDQKQTSKPPPRPTKKLKAGAYYWVIIPKLYVEPGKTPLNSQRIAIEIDGTLTRLRLSYYLGENRKRSITLEIWKDRRLYLCMPALIKIVQGQEEVVNERFNEYGDDFGTRVLNATLNLLHELEGDKDSPLKCPAFAKITKNRKRPSPQISSGDEQDDQTDPTNPNESHQEIQTRGEEGENKESGDDDRMEVEENGVEEELKEKEKGNEEVAVHVEAESLITPPVDIEPVLERIDEEIPSHPPIPAEIQSQIETSTVSHIDPLPDSIPVTITESNVALSPVPVIENIENLNNDIIQVERVDPVTISPLELLPPQLVRPTLEKETTHEPVIISQIGAVPETSSTQFNAIPDIPTSQITDTLPPLPDTHTSIGAEKRTREEQPDEIPNAKRYISEELYRRVILKRYLDFKTEIIKKEINYRMRPGMSTAELIILARTVSNEFKDF